MYTMSDHHVKAAHVIARSDYPREGRNSKPRANRTITVGSPGQETQIRVTSRDVLHEAIRLAMDDVA